MRQKTLHREMDGDGRGRTRALHREAGAAQAELVGRARRQIILVVPDNRHLPVDADHRFVRQYLIAVKRLPFAGEHADRTGMARGIYTGVFKRLDRALEKNPMLGIDEFGFARAVTEKLRVEQFESRERRARLDESRELQHGIGNPRFAQFLIRPDCDRLDAVLQIRPKLLDILGAGTSNRHSDNCNSRFLAMIFLAMIFLATLVQAKTAVFHESPECWSATPICCAASKSFYAFRRVSSRGRRH